MCLGISSNQLMDPWKIASLILIHLHGQIQSPLRSQAFLIKGGALSGMACHGHCSELKPASCGHAIPQLLSYENRTRAGKSSGDIELFVARLLWNLSTCLWPRIDGKGIDCTKVCACIKLKSCYGAGCVLSNHQCWQLRAQLSYSIIPSQEKEGCWWEKRKVHRGRY